MANMPGRNGVASSIHYPLPQPATTPMGQAHTQQVVWHFTSPLTLPRVIRIAIFGAIAVLARIGVVSIKVNQPE